MKRREVIIGVLGVIALPRRARAAEVRPWDAKAFAGAQDSGQGIVVYVHAPW